AAALRAALALDAPGAQAEARALEADPQPDLAAAARGEPEPPRPREPLLGDCLPQLPAAAPPAGCLSRPAGAPLDGALASRARAAARLALYSDDGADRAAACALLLRLDGEGARPLLAPFSRDPERRVRTACAANKTDPR